MTPDDVKLALHEVLGGGVFLNTATFVAFVCGWVLATAVAAGVGAFFGKRGETAALKRDLKTIKESLAQTTAVTEEIKADISGALWLKQKRWDIKWECYSKLVEQFGELHARLAHAMAVEKAGRDRDHGETPEQYTARFNAVKEEIEDGFEVARRYGSIARLVVPAEIRTRLTCFAEEWMQCTTIGDEYAAARRIWLDLLDLGREDLGIEPRESYTTTGGAA